MAAVLIALFVLLDITLLYWIPVRRWFRHWGATYAEIQRDMRGDREVASPNYETTLGVTVNAPAADVWPWLAQMGNRRGGLYSYDWLDRLFGYLKGPSADRILPEFQELSVGDVIPIGRAGGFPVTAIEPRRALVMSGAANGMLWMWELALYPIDGTSTRLISRNRAHVPKTTASRLVMMALEPAAFIMTRKMLLNLKHRAETTARMLPRSVHASRREQTKSLPGDAIIAHAIGSLTHAITIERGRHEVWPWLAQMGAGSRAGWYSYDRLDNGRRPSAAAIRPELQQIARGTVFPALPGVTDGFVVIDFEPSRFLVLGWPAPEGMYLTTWTFVLEELTRNRTRLITRARAASGYPFFGMPQWIGAPMVRAAHFVMQRKQLLNLAKRAEHVRVTAPASSALAARS
jgi:hypothetical protein